MIFPPVVVAGGRPEVAFQTMMTDAADAMAYSFSGVPFGAVKPRRKILVGVGLGTSTGFFGNATAVTIGGVAATNTAPKYWIADVPSGTSGTIAITCAAHLNCTISVWSILRLRSATAVGSIGSTSPLPASITVKPNGFVFGISRGIVGTTDIVWSGVTENSQIGIEGGFLAACASQRMTSAGSQSVNVTLSGSGGSPPYYLVSLR